MATGPQPDWTDAAGARPGYSFPTLGADIALNIFRRFAILKKNLQVIVVMSHIRLRPAPLVPVEAVAGYDQDDYTLIVGPRGVTPADTHRASIDTLTLLFTPDTHVLTGFDAYTSAETWERQSLTLPSTDQKKALTCIEPFDKHGIGPTGAGPVRYFYSRETSRLLLQIGGGPIATRIRCLTCVICGLGFGGELHEIWVAGLTW